MVKQYLPIVEGCRTLLMEISVSDTDKRVYQKAKEIVSASK